jgi:hypothetical protein
MCEESRDNSAVDPRLILDTHALIGERYRKQHEMHTNLLGFGDELLSSACLLIGEAASA